MTQSRKFRVLDSSGLMGQDFTGMELEFVTDHVFPFYIVLKQPEFDNSGKPCLGYLIIDKKSVQEVSGENPDFYNTEYTY